MKQQQLKLYEKKVEELKNENELLLKTNTRLKQAIDKLKNTTITSSNLNI